MRYLTLILMLIVTVTAHSQNFFKLTPEGFKHHNSDYVFMALPNKQPAQLFNLTNQYIAEGYKSPKDVVEQESNKMINLKGYMPKCVRQSSLNVFDMEYSIVVKFKQAKVIIDAPTFRLTNHSGGQDQTLHLSLDASSLDEQNVAIYDESGKLQSSKAKKDLEAFFNDWVKELKEYLTEKRPEEVSESQVVNY